MVLYDIFRLFINELFGDEQFCEKIPRYVFWNKMKRKVVKKWKISIIR